MPPQHKIKQQGVASTLRQAPLPCLAPCLPLSAPLLLADRAEGLRISDCGDYRLGYPLALG